MVNEMNRCKCAQPILFCKSQVRYYLISMLLFMITFTAYFITAIICDRRFGIAIAMGMPLIMFLGILPGIGMIIALVKQQKKLNNYRKKVMDIICGNHNDTTFRGKNIIITMSNLTSSVAIRTLDSP